jgi:hypothetical protein
VYEVYRKKKINVLRGFYLRTVLFTPMRGMTLNETRERM